MGGFEICVDFTSSQGKRGSQEDRYLACELSLGIQRVAMVAVLDGHGGQNCVDYLVQHLAPTLQMSFSQHVGQPVHESIAKAYRTIDEQLCSSAKKTGTP